jgi:Asp/Glu/hydantoin racemase
VCELRAQTNRPVIGIFEASVVAALQLLPLEDRFGIISTGQTSVALQPDLFASYPDWPLGVIWEDLLNSAVHRLLGGDSLRFAGVETTGLNAIELHRAPAETVKCRLQHAVKRLLRRKGGNVGAICLGCAGMAGMDDTVREACVQELGNAGSKIKIIDGVKAGIGCLHAALQMQF